MKYPKKVKKNASNKFPGAQRDILKLLLSEKQSKTNILHNRFTITKDKEKQIFTFDHLRL